MRVAPSISSPFCDMSKQRSAEGICRSALSGKMRVFGGLFGQFFHRRDESNVRAAGWSLGGGHLDGAFRSCATAILFRAVEARAALARNADFFGHGLVARNLLFDDLNHATFAAGVDFFGDGVKMAGFHLASLGAIAGGLTANPKHGTA
jgi:hypothetical protein